VGGVAKSEQAARARARQQRVALDRDRAARDQRIEDATTEVFLAFEVRAQAVQAVGEAEDKIAAAVQLIRGEDVKPGQIAELCEMSLGDVRRYSQRRSAPTVKAVGPVGRPTERVRVVGDDERATG